MRTLRILLFGFLLGVMTTAAAQVWGWGHTSGDRAANELRQMRDSQDIREIQRDLTKQPC